MWSRRAVLQLTAATAWALAACRDAPDPVGERALGDKTLLDAESWLFGRQAGDGSFRGDVHAELAPGQFLTPFCLVALTEMVGVPGRTLRARDVHRGLDYLRGRKARIGALGFSTDPPERPLEATALALLAFYRMRPTGRHGDETAPMIWWLRRQQLAERRGFSTQAERGGFTRGWWRPATPHDAPPVRMSWTRHAVQALDAVGAHANDPALREASGFVERTRLADGSWGDGPTGSGASGSAGATADALMTLVCAGREPETLGEPLASLEALRPLGGPSGPAAAQDPVRFRTLATAAGVYERTGAGPAGWQDALIQALADTQAGDGNWHGASGSLEDEPMVATGYAIAALAAALRSAPRPRWRRR